MKFLLATCYSYGFLVDRTTAMRPYPTLMDTLNVRNNAEGGAPMRTAINPLLYRCWSARVLRNIGHARDDLVPCVNQTRDNVG